MIIEQAIKRAVDHHLNDEVNVGLPIDGIAFYGAINIINMILNDSKDNSIKYNKGKIDSIPDQSQILYKSIYKKSEDGNLFFVHMASLMVFYRLEGSGNILYNQTYIGDHNSYIIPKKLLSNKVGTFILPFDLLAVIEKKLMPIDVLSAITQNPFHPSFKYILSPSPATALAIDHDLGKAMPFITHPKLLSQFHNLDDEKRKSLMFDSHLAMEILKENHGLELDKKIMDSIKEIDNKLAKMDGTACIEIF